MYDPVHSIHFSTIVLVLYSVHNPHRTNNFPPEKNNIEKKIASSRKNLPHSQ